MTLELTQNITQIPSTIQQPFDYELAVANNCTQAAVMLFALFLIFLFIKKPLYGFLYATLMSLSIGLYAKTNNLLCLFLLLIGTCLLIIEISNLSIQMLKYQDTHNKTRCDDGKEKEKPEGP